MVVLVTGANGQLGKEIGRFSTSSAHSYIFKDKISLNITNKDAVRDFIVQNRVDVIINCAAYTNVDMAECNEIEAELINSTSVANLAEIVKEVDGTLFQISTDYVFGQNSFTPIKEDMATNPLCIYGRTKLRGEQSIIEAGCKALIIRTSWLYSEFGNNFLKTILRLGREQMKLNVVFDQVGTPTYARDLAEFICSIIESQSFKGNEGIYHFSNEGVCSWYDFAIEVLHAVGNDVCKVMPCLSSFFPSKAVRPSYSVLDKGKVKHVFGVEISHWRDAMLRCVERIKGREG